MAQKELKVLREGAWKVERPSQRSSASATVTSSYVFLVMYRRCGDQSPCEDIMESDSRDDGLTQ
jgi:hypothetical protein